jgi:hypothetical protein
MRKIFTYFLFISTNFFITTFLNGQRVSCRCNFKPCVQKNDTIPVVFRRTACNGRFVNEEPLLIIDGTVFEYNQFPKINPNDIESIDILKETFH